jgi:hypothetical protein
MVSPDKKIVLCLRGILPLLLASKVLSSVGTLHNMLHMMNMTFAF